MRNEPRILDRDAELAAARRSVAAAAVGRGTMLQLLGPAGIGKTTVLRLVCAEAAAHGLRILTARGLPLEQEFSYGVVRQLFETVLTAAGKEDLESLFDGAARLSRCVFDGPDDGPDHDPAADPGGHSIVHGLYWLAANLAARRPLVLAVDDAQWADPPSLRWLSHLAARLDDLPVLLLLAARSGPDQPELLTELRGYPAAVPLELRPLREAASTELVTDAFGGHASPGQCEAAYAATGGNPFLLHALLHAVEARGGVAKTDEMTVLSLGPQPVADAMVRRIGQLGPASIALVQAVAVFGRPVPLRNAAALASVGLSQAAAVTDRLRGAGVLTAAGPLDFEYSIVRAAIYDSMPPAARAMAHARVAQLLQADGAEAELVGLHLLRSEPAADAQAVAALRAAAAEAASRGSAETAARYLRRALAEPPPPAERAEILLDLGLALASDRDEAAVPALREAVEQAAAKGRPALLAAGVLGVWGHHDSAVQIIGAGLSDPGAAAADREQLEAELLANSWVSVAKARSGWERARPWLDRPRPGIADWHIYRALSLARQAQPGAEVRAAIAPALDNGPDGFGHDVIARDSPARVIAMLALTWNDDLVQAQAIGDVVFADAEARGSINMMAHVGCLRSTILRRLGRIREAADDSRAGFEFRLRTSPPVAVAWAATFFVEALTRLGSFDEAADIVARVEARRPPPGWLQTIGFIQARGTLRLAQHRYEESLADLRTAAKGWRALGIDGPAAAYWRIPAVGACAALGREQEAARFAAEHLELSRRVGGPGTLGVALRVAAPYAPDPEQALAESISLLSEAGHQFERAYALAALGAHRRRVGRRADAKEPLRQALDFAERSGAAALGGYARTELVAAGARPRRAALTGPAALTDAERQVAALAAAGNSNRQIAQHLFVSQATVETHLRHAFHKLGISSRTDLPADLN